MLGRRSLMSRALFGATGDSLLTAGPREFLFSDLGLTLLPTDSVYPNRHFAARVVDPLNVEQMLPFAPGGARRSAATIGDLMIINADGALDRLRSAPVDGRAVQVWQGRPGADFATFDLIYKGTAAGWREANDNRLTLGLRGAAWQVEVPLARSLYLGSGGLEGGADLAGQFKPAIMGKVTNAQPVLVDAFNQIYQGHFRRMLAYDGIFDGGVAYTPAGDVADITLASVSPGQVKTQLSAGLFKLGTAPTKTVTFNARGDAPDGIYIDRASEIAFRLLHDFQALDDGWFEINTFDDLRGAAPGPVGLYIGLTPVTAAAVMDELFAGINGWWAENRFGRIEVGLIGLPVALPRARLSTKDIMEFERLALPDAMDPPIWRVRVGYARNWSPMDITQIGGAIVSGDAARFEFLTQEFRFVTAEDVTVRIRNLRAQEFTLLSAYGEEADAQALADRLLAIYSGQRRLARIRTKRQGMKLPLGGTIALDYPRYGLSGGVNVVVVGKSIVAATHDCSLTVMW